MIKISLQYNCPQGNCFKIRWYQNTTFYGKFILFMYNLNNGWFEWPSQHPQMHHPKNPVLGFHGWMKLSPRGQFTLSVFIIFLLVLFSPVRFFFPSLVVFFLGTIFLSLFFSPHLWPPSFFFGKLLPTHNLPTALLPTNPLTSLILQTPPHPPPFALTSIARAKDSLSSSKLWDKLRNMETQGKMSFNVVAEVGASK